MRVIVYQASDTSALSKNFTRKDFKCPCGCSRQMVDSELVEKLQAIRDKPETLIRAIKDAQAAATYMDYKAGLITDKEYEKACGSVLEVKQKERDQER